MNMASDVSDRQFAKDRDAAYLALRLETSALLKAYKAEGDLRRAMLVYNEGMALAQANFKTAMQKAKGDQAARARGDAEDPW